MSVKLLIPFSTLRARDNERGLYGGVRWEKPVTNGSWLQGDGNLLIEIWKLAQLVEFVNKQTILIAFWWITPLRYVHGTPVQIG